MLTFIIVILVFIGRSKSNLLVVTIEDISKIRNMFLLMLITSREKEKTSQDSHVCVKTKILKNSTFGTYYTIPKVIKLDTYLTIDNLIYAILYPSKDVDNILFKFKLI